MNAAGSASKIKAFSETALMSAVMCILGPFSIPIGIIPFSLTPFAVFLAVYILGTKKGTVSCLIYLLIGLAGLPVFSGFSGGPGKLLGPTGGFLLGFLPMALIGGFFIHRFYKKIPLQLSGMFLGLCACYLFGTVWLAFAASLSLPAAFAAGVAPFIAFDVIKIGLSVAAGRAIRGKLIRSGLLRAYAKS